MKQERMLRIEVKVGWRNKSGYLQHNRPPKGKFDILAVVASGEDITYFPSLDTLFSAPP
jgi:hypothetical protein